MSQQPQQPGQPYVPPSAPSAAGSYVPASQPAQYQVPAAAPSYQQPGQYQPGVPGAAGTYDPNAAYQPQYQQGAYPATQGATVAGSSLVSDLFDTSRDFTERHARLIMILTTIWVVLLWVFGSIMSGVVGGADLWGHSEFSFGSFFLALLAGVLPTILAVLGTRALLELVITSARTARASASTEDGTAA